MSGPNDQAMAEPTKPISNGVNWAVNQSMDSLGYNTRRRDPSEDNSFYRDNAQYMPGWSMPGSGLPSGAYAQDRATNYVGHPNRDHPDSTNVWDSVRRSLVQQEGSRIQERQAAGESGRLSFMDLYGAHVNAYDNSSRDPRTGQDSLHGTGGHNGFIDPASFALAVYGAPALEAAAKREHRLSHTLEVLRAFRVRGVRLPVRLIDDPLDGACDQLVVEEAPLTDEVDASREEFGGTIAGRARIAANERDGLLGSRVPAPGVPGRPVDAVPEKHRGGDRQRRLEDAISQLPRTRPARGGEEEIDAALMVDRKESRSMGAAVLLQKRLKRRPARLQVVAVIATKPEPIDDGGERPPIRGRGHGGVRNQTPRPELDVFGGDSRERNGVPVTQQQVTDATVERDPLVRHSILHATPLRRFPETARGEVKWPEKGMMS